MTKSQFNKGWLEPLNHARSFSQRFSTKHILRAGAVVWVKHRGKDHYLVFKSHSRPNRGTQLPGGRVEKVENPGKGIIREVYEETGVKTRIVCPLGIIFYENPNDNYSRLQLYYIVRPLDNISVHRKWLHTDKDKTRQKLECWFESIDKNSDYLAAGQSQAIEMFKEWLVEHKKPEK